MAATKKRAAHLPIARILPLVRVAHLDRPFDYYVSEDQDAAAQPGVRVRIRFAGRRVDGIVLERSGESEHPGKLSWIERVISPEVVYPEQTRRLVEALTQRYGGITADLVRLAVPSRVAKVEETDTSTPWESLGNAVEPDLSSWANYVHGSSFVDAVLDGQAARAVWQVAPGDSWSDAIAALAVKVVLEGGGALIVVPDARDLALLERSLKQYVSAKQITELSSSLGPQARYRRYLSVVHGQGRLVIGTRSAAFAPVANLRLAVIKDDGDENLVDQLAPYVHAREVLTTRSTLEKCALVIVGTARTAEAQLLVDSGWAHDLVSTRERVRALMPYIHATADSDFALERDPLARSARIPSAAFAAIRKALDRDKPVLIQVPRKGYIPVLACAHCRASARCRHCNGPLSLPTTTDGSAGLPTCGWCGRQETKFSCMECGGHSLRAIVLGAQRTAEELGRAFPGVPIISSGGTKVVDEVPAKACVVVSTPGAEPEVVDGQQYGAAVLLDGWVLLGRQDLRASEDTLAKWFAAAVKVEPGTRGGEVVVVADSSLSVVQSLILFDPVAAARRELAQRAEVHLPPAANIAAIDGARVALESFLDTVELPDNAEILGPVDLPPGVKLPGEFDREKYGVPQRLIIRTPLGPRNQLGGALRRALIARAALKNAPPIRIQVDPIKVG